MCDVVHLRAGTIDPECVKALAARLDRAGGAFMLVDSGIFSVLQGAPSEPDLTEPPWARFDLGPEDGDA